MKSTILTGLLELDRPKAWPPELCAYLGEHYDLLLEWETRQNNPYAPAYDSALQGLMDILQPYVILGRHCTRLTAAEADDILRSGMQMPDAAMPARRIDALVESNEIAPDLACLPKSKNQSDEKNRAGMVWFCFFPPRKAGEEGIERFFRHWGGEALYNSHEDDPVTSPAIRVIGTPCIVEVDVPVSSLAGHERLALNIVRRFLASRDHCMTESTDYEDRIVRPLLARNVRRVIRFPDPDFFALTGCAEWRRPIIEAEIPSC